MGASIIPIFKQKINRKPVDTFLHGKAKKSIVSPELLYLSEYYKYIIPSNLIFQITENNKILIKILFEDGKKEGAELEFAVDFPFLINTSVDTTPQPEYIISEGPLYMNLSFPISRLKGLNDIKYKDLLKNVKPLYPPITNSGVVRSNGDIIQRSKIVRDTYRLDCKDECLAIDGSGIKIGVISDSYNTQKYTIFNNPDDRISQNKPKAEIDMLNGDLPGEGNPNGYNKEVLVKKESMFQATDEGRAMLQIIHDVAPGAELAFHSASTLEEFNKAIEVLKEVECSIIVDDLTFIEESFFGAKSYISKAINDFTNNDKNRNFYFSSAGNFGKFGYQGVFKSKPSERNTDFISSGEKDRDTIFRTHGDNIVLFQKVQFCKEGIYMIVLQWDESQINVDDFNDLDIYLVDDNGRLLTGNNRFNTHGDSMEYLVFVVKEKTTANILITSAKGATNKDIPFRYIVFRHNNGFSYNGMEERKTPTVSGHAMLEKIITVGAVKSNFGNVQEIRNYSSYGGRLTNNPPTSIDIDFAAPDGENINVALIGQDTNNDHFQNFYGTSASAPHAAGAFALMMGALEYCKSEELQPDDIDVLQLFKDTCQNLNSPSNGGSGLINTEDAFIKLLADYPILNTSIVNNMENSCEKITEKTIINIVANNISCEYGQSWNLTYHIEGMSENEYSNLGLPNIKLKTTAVNPYPDVNNYRIIPYFKGVLNPEQETLFKIHFIPGVLSISKKDLVIKVENKSFIEGNPFNIEFEYEYNTDEIENNGLFLSTLKEEHGSTFYSEKNMIILIEKFIDHAVNRGNIPPPPRADDVLYWLLETGSWMTLISKNTIENLYKESSNGNHIYTIEFRFFEEYLKFLKLEGDSRRFRPLSNNYRPLANNYRPLANNYRPLANNYRPLANNYRPLANNYRPLANNYRPLANTDSNNDDPVENPMHLILDEEFLKSTKEIEVYEYHSINIITGLSSGEEHYIFPGSFFANMSNNFNVKYQHGRFNIIRNSINK